MHKYKLIINKNIIYNIYCIVGNNTKKKHKLKKYIINNINNTYKNIIKYNFFINKKFKWNLIIKEIINENIISKNKIFILNIIENIKDINNIFNKYILKFITKNIYIIFFFEIFYKYKYYINKNKNILLIELNKKNKFVFLNKVNKIINQLINNINNKKLKNIFNIIKNIKNLNVDKILILNILFKNFIKNINNNKILNTVKILKIFYKYEKNYKMFNKLYWNDIELICIYIIKY